jgi:hypothetical protein
VDEMTVMVSMALKARVLGAAFVLLGAWALVGAGASGSLYGQTHKVAKPETVVRAVGVYEWTGDLAKPAASRLIPVTVFIDGELQDAGVYLARPIPFALQSGNVYELQQAGIAQGTVELSFAKHLQAVDTATGATQFDDGWFGYGSFKAPAAAKKGPVLQASGNLAKVKSSKDDGKQDDGKPHFADKKGDGDGSADSATSADADRPTMKRRDGGSSGSGSGSSAGSGSGSGSGGSGSTASDASAPADDPDRPHLSKRTSSDSSGDGSTADSGGSGEATTTTASTTKTTPEGGSADDPDRPTLKRRSPEEMKRDRKREDSASVTGVGSLNDDPDRPNLHRGKPASAMTEDDLPKLTGLPVDVKQMVAVSDPKNRDPHDFARAWEDDAERTAILTKMQGIARTKLAGYGVSAPATAGTAPTGVKAGATAAARAAAARRAAAAKQKAAPAPAIPLLDEELKGYTLSYGGAATYVYTAHTAGTGAALDYVTVVAQADALGDLKVAMSSVTDAAHLDRTPRLRLVDAVDVQASNRASLLFELRAQKSRQFGLYSVIGAQADQQFLTGSTQ